MRRANFTIQPEIGASRVTIHVRPDTHAREQARDDINSSLLSKELMVDAKSALGQVPPRR
jgi:hypothetical protein